MMDGLPVIPPDGIRYVASRQAAAGVGRWAVVKRDGLTVPSWDPARGVLFAGDVRLYNRAELLTALDTPELDRACSDLELARLAYLRWGEESPNHLVGDF